MQESAAGLRLEAHESSRRDFLHHSLLGTAGLGLGAASITEVSAAQEKGLKPIELINGDQLVKLMEELHIGLRQTYVVDQEFFDEFADGAGK